MRDRETGRSRGFAFVTFSNEAEANAAIDNLNESDLDGRRIRVNPANTRGGGGGGGGGGSSKSLFFLYKTITRCPHHCRIRWRWLLMHPSPVVSQPFLRVVVTRD